MAVSNLQQSKQADDKQAKLLQQMKYMPYFIIFDFALLTACLRLYLSPEWGWWHLPLLLYQVLLFFGLWHLIKFINKQLNKYVSFERGPMWRMSLQLLISLVAVSPILIGGIYTARKYGTKMMNEDVYRLTMNKDFIAVMIMMVIVVLIMFNFAFYTFHFFQHWQITVNEKASLEVQAASLKKEKSDLQYHQLKNQVNPHYLFNMLTSLDGLVHTNPDLASDFIRHMSKVYRYVLQHKDSEVVNLSEELEFIAHYVQLLNIRYGEAVNIKTEIADDTLDNGVVMITLQMLIDNAIKHNSTDNTSPLNILITTTDDYLAVSNNKQLRRQIETSNGKGLAQLKQLYSFLTDKKIVIEDTPAQYIIKIPLL